MAKTTYSREELERQLSESRRELRAADATIHNLELQLAEVVSVHDERAAFEAFMEKRFKDCIDRRLVKNGDGEYFAWDMQVAWIVWKGRAAMLQGAEPVTTAYRLPFEQWLSQQTGAIDVECGCVMTEVFYHWLRVAYEAGNSQVIPDDVRRMDWLVSKTVDVREPMFYGSHSLFWSQTITDEEDDYHATKLREQIDAAMAVEQAAAPQQEVKK